MKLFDNKIDIPDYTTDDGGYILINQELAKMLALGGTSFSLSAIEKFIKNYTFCLRFPSSNEEWILSYHGEEMFLLMPSKMKEEEKE